jgi:hypothetical protein
MHVGSLNAERRVTEYGLRLARRDRVAQDGNGSRRGYRVEPRRNDTGRYENEAGRCNRPGNGPVHAREHSLRAVAAERDRPPAPG